MTRFREFLSCALPSYPVADVGPRDQTSENYPVTEPTSEVDWEKYFDLRWRVLRELWGQPRGSERDEREDQSIHLMICDASQTPVAIGRLHFLSPSEAQIRYMAVEPTVVGRGFGSRILRGLEDRARARGVRRVVLNARKNVTDFYRKNGYHVVGPAETLFGVIEHVRMEKEITS
jgi:N-acetylglutamate synthase-like GNAT family acetyltransferase